MYGIEKGGFRQVVFPGDLGHIVARTPRGASMKIAVILRLTPDITEELELTEDGRDIDREWIGLVLNEFDDQALEQAVLLKESTGAEVTALAVDGEGVERLLRTALARGADAAYRIPVADVVASSRTLAPLHAAAVRTIGADLVLTGVLATDDLHGELAPYLGSELGWRQASAVSDVQIMGVDAVVRQEYSGGRAARLAIPLPAVIGLQTASQPPRYVSGSRLRDLLKVDVPELAVDAEPAATGMQSAVLALPQRGAGAEMIDGDGGQIAESLHAILIEKGLV